MTLKLFAHQERCVRAMMLNARYGLWLEPGMGKTITTLEAIRRDAEMNGGAMRTVVVCPKSIMSSAWMKDAQHFKTSLDVRVLASDSPAKRIENIESRSWNVGLINFDQFKMLAAKLIESGVKRLVIDESSKIKNHDSQITKAAIWFADRMESVWLLSGTPAPNSPIEYYGQIRAMRRDICGDLYWKWVHSIATARKERVWHKPRNARPRQIEVISGWSQNEAQRVELERQLGLCSIAMRKVDALDLPKQRDIVRVVELDEREAKMYHDAAHLLRVQLRQGDSEKINAEAALMKLRQITGGYFIDNGNPIKIGGSKLDSLNELLDEIGPQPCLIWAEFRHEIDAIVALCKERKESTEYIDGRTSGDAGSIASRFQAGEIQRLICQPMAAGHGITLTKAHYAIYYSLGFSYELFKQSRDRIHRVGQDQPCTYYILTAEDTVDEAAYGVVRGKGKVSDALLAVLSGNMKALS